MQGKVLVAIQFILLLILVISPTDVGITLLALFIALAGVIASIILFVIAAKELGQALTPLPESRQGASFITSGIYSQIRHPIYLALIIFSASVVIWKQSFTTLITSFALYILLNYKFRYEDRLLRAKFPEALAYQMQTPALIPKLRFRR
jgi:protein-S-isoprenylcysteine O-methyltransferase Ste14